MNEIVEHLENTELKFRPTSLTLKKGTKDLLDTLGSKMDSYDDIIRNLIKENKELKSQLENLKLLSDKSANKMFVSSFQRKKSATAFSQGKKIFFSFNIPKKPYSYFRFDIFYERVLFDEMELLDNFAYADPLTRAKDYLVIYEKLIKTYIDPLFKIDKRRILDLNWWKRKTSSLDLEESYKVDVKEKLISFGVMP